jgi:hypothetical protein
LLDHDILGRSKREPLSSGPRRAPAWFREEDMPEEIPEKSFREWLAEALAQDEKTWEALEEKVRTMRLKQGIVEDKKEPRDC